MTNITLSRAVVIAAFVLAPAGAAVAQPAPPLRPFSFDLDVPPVPEPPDVPPPPLAPMPPSFAVAVMPPPPPQAPQPRPAPRVTIYDKLGETGTPDDLYAQARDLIERSRYDAALDRLNRLTSQSEGKDAA